MIQEWWGLVDHIKDVCDRFAAAGFVALAPDLYHGQKVQPGEPDEAGKAMMAMKMDQAARDMSGAVDEVLRRSSGDRVGVIGFCMGGGLALVLATQRPDAVAAVVPCYGIIPWPDAQPDYAAMSAAVLGHYAENDSFFTPEAANALADQLRGMGKSVEIVVYPGTDHAFFNDTRPEVYDAEARTRCGTARWRSSASRIAELSRRRQRSVGRSARAGRGPGASARARLLPSASCPHAHVTSPPLLPVHPRLEREVPGQGADGAGRHDLPRPRGRRGAAREGERPAQGGRRHQEPALGRPRAVRARQRLGHRVDLRRRDRGGRATPASASTRSCCPRCSRRRRSSRSTCC